jgi:Zn-dependent protease with chaperone function
VNYALRGAILGLAWFLLLNVPLSAVVALCAGRARRSSSLLFALRLLPAAASIAFVAAVFVPSYWRFEPRDFQEGFDLTLTIVAVASAALLVGASGRAATAWWRAARRTRSWIQTAEPLALAGVAVPAFRIEAPQPVMALVGILRPRLLVTRGLIEALTPEELAASIAHEIGHHHAWDNLKRLAMRGAPDLLSWMPAARTLEHEWAAASEHTADAAPSIAGDQRARLALASALVKVARLMPTPTPLTEPISTLVGGGAIASRVQRLIDDGSNAGEPRRHRRMHWLAATAAAAASLALGYTPLLETVHRATEVLVHRLP